MQIQFSAAPLDQIEADLLVVGVPEAGSAAVQGLEKHLSGLTALLAERGFKGKRGDAVDFATFGAIPARRIAFVGTGDGSDDSLAAAAGKAGLLAREAKAAAVALDLGPLDAVAATRVLSFVAVGNYVDDRYFPEDRIRPAITSLTVASNAENDALRAAAVKAGKLARWQNFTRDLVNAPAADIYPATLAEKAQELAELPNVEVEVWDFERCRAEGLVGIIAVGQGSSQPGCLIHIRYRPENPVDHIALVGKGVTFDAGGLSLKPTSGMQTMRCDMGGGGTVLGAAGAIAALELPIAVDTFVPAVENMCAANSFKLGDILRYNNGVTVEIHNTDAEGRLILADALILASKVPGVSRVVDLATLTGSMIIACGTDYTGLFSWDDALCDELTSAADASSELMWRMPLHRPYNRLLKGTWGQIKNVGGREAGSITAALFLSHFVGPDVRWAHMDIAGTAFADSPVDPYIAGGTGQVVRTLTAWAESLTK